MGTWRAALTALACALALYVPWLSIQLDPNGIIDAAAIEAGGPRLVHPNHLLYRPLGATIVATVHAAGRMGRAIGPLQILTAICAALAVALLLRAYAAVTPSAWSAALASAAFATSWAQWRYSTDAHYIGVATLAMSAALAGAVLVRSVSGAAAAGIACGLGVLGWEANVCAVPALAALVLVTRRSLGAAAAFVAGAAGTATIGYAVAYALASDGRGLVQWATSYGGGALPIWGRWDALRLAEAAETWAVSIVPLWEGLGLRALLRGEALPSRLLGYLSLVALVAMVAATAACAVAAVRRDRVAMRPAAMFLLGFVLYLPFIVWWEPGAPQWFIVPNAFLFAAAAMVWSGAGARVRALLCACVVVIAAANFRYAILPNHTVANVWIGRARCISDQLAAEDAVVVTDWDWLDYAEYLFGYRGGRVRTVDARPREDKLAEIAAAIAAAQRRGGHVYAVDVRTYDRSRAEWLTVQTGLTAADLESFAPVPAFTCDGLPLVELRGANMHE